MKAGNTLIHPSFSTTVHSQHSDFAITVNDHPIKQTTGYHLTHELGVKMTHNDKINTAINLGYSHGKDNNSHNYGGITIGYHW